MIMADWPLVSANDDGIRPAGPPDECFYCQQKIGSPHGAECVIVTKRVRVAFTIIYDYDVPWFWDKKMIEFHNGGGSSGCGDNRLDQIVQDREEAGTCLCEGTEIQFLGVIEDTPKCKERPAAEKAAKGQGGK